ncbi:MAG: NADH-ubiquinone oxidoreductase-F iron-sulfur binding region domain-containing protein [Nocardioides sp.]
MTSTAISGLGQRGLQRLTIRSGPTLLRGLAAGPGLAAHRAVHGRPAPVGLAELRRLTEAVGLRGRGGAGFPFARKLAATADARGRPVVVVNLSEGEPASFKDAALALVAPHLVLDGAASTARALGVRTVHLVVPGEAPAVEDAVRRATAERRKEDRTRWRLHRADPRFVAGQARAVIELLSGRENLPVTSWQPEAVRGFRNRPTLLSNAETFAQVGALLSRGPREYADRGSDAAGGTTLLTLRGDTAAPHVVEVPHGTPWREVLGPDDVERPVLLGGFHGTWVAPGGLVGLAVDRDELTARELALGAGVVLPLPEGSCPLTRTAAIVDYLAGQSAGRCGPCLNGLPALARTVHELAAGTSSPGRTEQLIGLVTRRGACAHPDGTARLVSSMLRAFPDEHEVHARGECAFAVPAGARR